MSATAPTIPATLKSIGDKVDSLGGKIQKIESITAGLVEMARVPASKAGMKPEEWLAKMSAENPNGYTLGPGGTVWPTRGLPRQPGRRKSLGWGPMLRDLGTITRPGAPSDQIDAASNRLFKSKSEGGLGLTRVDPATVQKTALAESSGAAGGYTVPPEMSAELLSMEIEEGVVRPRASVMPMDSATLMVPYLDVTTKLSAGQTPFLGGIVMSWLAEAGNIPESEPQFRMVEGRANQASFYTVASNTLLADNAVGLDALLTQLFGAAVPWYTDYAYLQGSGAGQPEGVLNANATIQYTRAIPGRFTYQDAAGMLSKLYAPLRKASGVCWLMHQSVIPQLLNMTDPAGRVVFIPLSAGAQEAIGTPAGSWSFGLLFGIPVILTEKLPALGTLGDVMLVDLSKYLLFDRQDIIIDVSPHVKFLNYQMVWRVIWRGDGHSWLSGAITLADGTYTVSAFIALK